MSYEIIVKFQSDKSPESFIELIQDVYDINGVDGICSVERDESSAFSPANGLIARFHRETEDDWEYVALRACNATTVGGVETVSLLRAAVYASAIAQLRSEITLYDTHADAMAPMVEALEKGGLSVSINNFDELYQACVDGVKNDFVKFTLDLHKDVPATASADVLAPKRFQRDPRALSGLAKMLADEGNLAFAPDWGAASATRLVGASVDGQPVPRTADISLEGQMNRSNLEAFAMLVARMKYQAEPDPDGEDPEGDGFYHMDSEDAVETLSNLIVEARRILGLPENLYEAEAGDDDENAEPSRERAAP